MLQSPRKKPAERTANIAENSGILNLTACNKTWSVISHKSATISTKKKT